MKFNVLPNHAVLKILDKSKQKHGNIIIPDLGNQKTELGEVIDPGVGEYNYHTDRLIPTHLKKGDIVPIPKMGSQNITIGREEYIICQLNQLGVTIEL